MVTLPTLNMETASREELVALISAQQAAIAQLQERVAALEKRLGSSGGKGMPGLKPAAEQRSKATGKPRKRRARGSARQRSPRPTRQVTHVAPQCPDCGARLRGGWVVRRREVIDLPVTPVEVVEHVVMARRCPGCARDVTPVVDLGEVVIGRQRFSARLVSLLATLREVGRLPIKTVQWLMRTLYDLPVSVGRIVAASAQVAQRGAAAVAAIREQVRASPAVYADETGWRQNGGNGYVWTFATPTLRYFAHGTREGVMVDIVLGEHFSGILASDFYAAYHHYPGLKQRCWAHLLRELHELTRVYPDDAVLAAWKKAVQRLYATAKTMARTRAGRPERERVAAQQACEQRLDALCAPVVDDPVAVHAKLCRRLRRHLSELFVFVAHPEVAADNNLAERSLRPLVTARKISGGTRSDAGTATKMATASLFGTWLIQGRDLLPACRQLLLSGQL